MDMLTAEEKERLEARLNELKANRPGLSKRIGEARELGDLKENAEYHAAKEEQGMQEAEIRRLEERLAGAVVASSDDMPEGVVSLGSVVRLKDTADGTDDLYKLVGEATGGFDADEIEVTVNSPMGESLLQSRIGETIKVDLPRGTSHFEILEIL